MAELKKTDKKPNFFVAFAMRSTKWFREMKAELKKVVWPNLKQVTNNTGIVLATVLVMSLLISLFGVAASQGISLLIGLAA